MTVRAGHGRRWAGGWAPVVGAALALVLLVPIGMLFVSHWRDLDDRVSVATHERHGVEYIAALGELTVALADAQSAAINGRAIPRHAVAGAVEATAEVDARLGEMHRVAQRWAQLRGVIDELTAQESADPRTAYAAYGEAMDLLLDLHHKLRETSGLIRDADPDTYYLQDGAGEELPETVVAASRLVDLVAISAAEAAEAAEAAAQAQTQQGEETGQEEQSQPGEEAQQPPGDPAEQPSPEQSALAQQAAGVAAISVARVAVAGPADDLANNIQAALDNTASRTLSSNVLSAFDRFLQAKDTLLLELAPGADPAGVDLARLDRIRVDMQAAATDLFHALLGEMDALLASRIDELRQRQWTAAGAAAVAALLAVGAAWASLAGGRRAGRGPTGGGQWAGGDSRTGPATETNQLGRGRTGEDRADVVQAELVEWERSGAR
jgi:hypothetical protein